MKNKDSLVKKTLRKIYGDNVVLTGKLNREFKKRKKTPEQIYQEEVAREVC